MKPEANDSKEISAAADKTTTAPKADANQYTLGRIGTHSRSGHPSDLGMSQWITTAANLTSVKSENRSPSLDSGAVSSLITSTPPNAVDSARVFCNSSENLAAHEANVSQPNTLTSQSANISSTAASSPYDSKSTEYYNYYNTMQQYPASFYPSYGNPYTSRAPAKISSPNSYLTSTYTAVAAATNNNSSQIYSSYPGYNNFGQFSSGQADYTGYYNEQYNYNPYTSGYSTYAVGSPGTSSAHGFHVSTGALSESPTDGHNTTPVLHSHSPNSPSSISANAIQSAASSKIAPGKTGRTRGRRHAQPSPTRSVNSETANPDNTKSPERVFIWDLDETIIIFHTLISGSFASRYTKDANHLLQLAYRMEELIFNMADTHFFFNEIEECDQVHIDDVSTDDNGQDLTNYNFAADGFHNGIPHPNGPPNLCLPTGVRGGVDWMRKLAFRYRKIKETYNTFKNK